MIKKAYVVKCESGLHARPVCELVKMAEKYNSKITVFYPAENREADAKNIIEILSLGVYKGAEIIIQAEGNDERQAVSDIVVLLDNIVE